MHAVIPAPLLTELLQWDQAGRPLPPPHAVKILTILEHAMLFRLGALVETGTYGGVTLNNVKPYFDHVYSIELSDYYYREASLFFLHDPNVRILHGSSGDLLPRLLPLLQSPCLFWLDAHFSGGQTARLADTDTPILEEVRAIAELGRPGQVLLIDDARCFTGEDGYPTAADLTALLGRLFPGCRVENRNDIIRVFASWPDGPALGSLRL